jgi:biopolymer transport protein TolQ
LLAFRISKFERLFWSGEILEDTYQKVKNDTKCPTTVVFVAGMQEWTNSSVKTIIKENDNAKKGFLKDRIFDIMLVASSRSLKKLRSGLNLLFIIASTSTLFGLLGTVWGISSSFRAISLMKDVTLASIAPSISASLITTIAGMLVAIPASMAYYFLRYKVSNYEEELNNFCLEFLGILSREIG